MEQGTETVVQECPSVGNVQIERVRSREVEESAEEAVEEAACAIRRIGSTGAMGKRKY